jgi:Putative transmembrane protein (PGPGW)
MTSKMATPRTTGRWGRLTVGWVLLVLGVAALVLPGPGLLMIAGGMAILSQQYLWARRRLAPVKDRAMKAAAAGVRNWFSLAVSVLAAFAGIAAGVTWGLQPAVPGWWPLDERWWLPGGWGTGSSLILSGCIALVLIGYSFWRFRIKEPQEAEETRTPSVASRAARLPAPTGGRSDSNAREGEST